MKNTILTLVFLHFVLFSFSQDGSAYELSYEVNRVYPSLSISKEKLYSAHTLLDLNKYYKPSWVRAYISVEVLTSYKGKLRKAIGKNGTLSQEQKDIMKLADVGTDISVEVRYIPENNLKHNDIKEMDFTFRVDPEKDAKYPGGQQALKQYLKEKAIDNIPDGSIKQYHLVAVKFTINEEGQVIDVHLFEPSKDKKTDELLLASIRNMPSWKPAEYATGLKVKQEFVFTVGDKESCVINLLNIIQD